MSDRFQRLGFAMARRLSVLILTVVAAALASAALVRFAPGFGMDERLLDSRLSEESLASIRSVGDSTGLAAEFGRYFAGLLRGDWGESISLHRPVRELMAERGALTAHTLGAGLIMAWILALVLAFALEAFRRRAADVAATVFAGALLCVPAAVVAMVFLYLAAPPALALAAILFPRIFRYVRNILAAASARPHVLAAEARGVGRCRLLCRHISLPAAGELFALAGVSVSMALGAVIPVEALCDSPGVGQLVWQSAMARDAPVLIHLTFVVALVTCAANLLTDGAQAAVSREAET